MELQKSQLSQMKQCIINFTEKIKNSAYSFSFTYTQLLCPIEAHPAFSPPWSLKTLMSRWSWEVWQVALDQWQGKHKRTGYQMDEVTQRTNGTDAELMLGIVCVLYCLNSILLHNGNTLKPLWMVGLDDGRLTVDIYIYILFSAGNLPQ